MTSLNENANVTGHDRWFRNDGQPFLHLEHQDQAKLPWILVLCASRATTFMVASLRPGSPTSLWRSPADHASIRGFRNRDPKMLDRSMADLSVYRVQGPSSPSAIPGMIGVKKTPYPACHRPSSHRDMSYRLS